MINRIQYIFWLVIDISGSIFGISLIYIGWNLKGDTPMSLEVAGWTVFGLGSLSLSVHGVHYLWSRFHCSDFFHTTKIDKNSKI
jgi:hypothetical protein